MRRSRLRQVSARQQLRQERLRELKELLVGQRGDRCERCYATRRVLDLHHLVGRGRGGQDEPENLALLCRECHRLVTDLKAHDWERWVLPGYRRSPQRGDLWFGKK